MSLPVSMSRRAKGDVNEAFEWWAEHRSLDQATRWYEGILKAIEAIGDQPTRFPRSAEAARFRFELREMLFGLGRRPTHRVLFTTYPDRIYMLGVRHVSQDEVSPDDLDEI